MKKTIIGSLCIVVFGSSYWLIEGDPQKARSALTLPVGIDTLDSGLIVNPIKDKGLVDEATVEESKRSPVTLDDQGLVKLDPTTGMILDEDDPLLIYAKTEYAKTSMKHGIENYIVPYSTSKPDKIYHSTNNIYRVMKDANGQWHLFPFNYTSSHMFSQAEQQKYLDNAPEPRFEIKHDYIKSAIENVVYMHGARDLDISCKNNICIGAFNRPVDAKVMWIIDRQGAEELMNEVIDRDPYVVGIMNCDIMGQKAIDKEPQDKKDCYIEVRAVYDPTGS